MTFKTHRFGYISLVLLTAVFLSLLTACGSDSHVAPPVISQPNFSSVPPSSASQGQPYTYTLSASDSTGSAITFTLVSAPDGATLNGNTLSWIPSAQQARQNNGFTVKASATTGKSATQSWTVAPTGTVQGSLFIMHWSNDGKVDIESNTVEYPYFNWAALVPQSDGSLSVLPGTGHADATFDIPNVPAGYYWLQFQPGDVIWTNANYMDYGSDAMGRRQREPIGQWFNCDVTGLDPWDPANHEIIMFSQNAQAFAAKIDMPWYGIPTPGSTTCEANNTLFPMGLNAVPGDVASTIQWELNPGEMTFFNTERTGPGFNEPLTMVTPYGTTTVSGEVAWNNPKTQDFSVAFSDWETAFNNAAPSTASPQGFQIFLESHETAPALARENAMLYGFVPILAGAQATPASAWPRDEQGQNLWPSDGDYGSITYNDLFSDWAATIYNVWVTAQYRIPFPNSDVPMTVQTQWVMQGPELPNRFAPLVQGIVNPQVNGTSLFNQTTVPSVSPTLAWTAPPANVPNASIVYTISICEAMLDAGNPICNFVYEFNNYSQNSFTVPAGILTPGHSYLFGIKTDLRTNYDPLHPNRYSFPEAWAWTVSGVITVSSSAPAGVVRGNRTLLRAKPGKTMRSGPQQPVFGSSFELKRHIGYTNSYGQWWPLKPEKEKQPPSQPRSTATK